MRAILALEDGRTFIGESFGAAGSTVGEVCFNTSMTGYQEVLTDPSYRGQIVAMTAPQIGNYGVNDLDDESTQIHVRGYVIEIAGRAPVARDGAQLLDDEPAHMRLRAFPVDLVHAVVADLRTSHRDDLAAIRRIGEHFLIPGHRSIEADLADRGAAGSKGFADEITSVFES